jgi:Bacteriophage Mu Gam like protein
MATETEDSTVILTEVDDRFHVRDEKSASWVVRKIVEERAHRQHVNDWHEAETRRSERREQFLLQRFGGELAEWTRSQLEQQYGNRRSLHLPAGTVGFRAEPTRIVIGDEMKLIGWCRQNLPSAVKVVESVLKSEISAHIKSSGECPDGAELAGGGEKFYIK